jgi:hypothetical protein
MSFRLHVYFTHTYVYVVAYWLKTRILEPAETAVAKERLCKQTPVTRQWLGNRHVIAVTISHTTIVELSEAVGSVRSVPRLYNVEQLLNMVTGPDGALHHE